ncbi:MAG: hypothetical protein ACI4DV_09335 [Lachnospiraceae bacterium]
MKKKILVTCLLALTMTLSTACGFGRNTADETPNKNNTNNTQNEQTYDNNTLNGSSTPNGNGTLNDNTQNGNAVNNNLTNDNQKYDQSTLPNDTVANNGDHNVITGTLSELKDSMFTLTDSDSIPYGFSFGNTAPSGYETFKEGDRVIITYSGTLNENEPFTGEIISIEKVK